MREDNTELFRSVPVSRAVISLALPTVLSQVVTVIYNMADTFFIAQLNDPVEVAAAQVAMPTFLFLTAVSNLFGLGGASVISRALGAGRRDRATKCSSFCVWSAALIAFFYGIAIALLRPVILPILGASDASYGYTYNYIFWTITVGAVPTVMSMTLAHLIRAEGYSKEASFGIALGGVLNIVLDPLFIYTLHLNVMGAAIATMLSNVAAALYFIIFIVRKRELLALRLDPRCCARCGDIPSEVLAVGLPSFATSFMAVISNSTLNHLVAAHSDEAIAGMGIAKKIDLLAFAIAQGMTQGSLPLIGYNFTSGDRKRMNSAIRTTLIYSFVVALSGAVLLFVGADFVTGMFIRDEMTASYGARFLKILSIACPTTSLNFMIITIFQATGRRVRPLILSLLRKGMIDLPVMAAFDHYIGVLGIAWATPISDAFALLIAAAVFFPYFLKLKRGEQPDMAEDTQ